MPPNSPSPRAESSFLLIRRQDSSCLPCTDPIAPCACAPDVCFQRGQSCTQCAENICPASSSEGGHNNLGATIGAALGGVLGILAAVALVYWFWWKPRGLAASRRRYSRHLTNRQSKIMGLGAAGGAAEKRASRQPTTGTGDSTPGSPTAVAKRSSVHLRMDGGQTTLSKRGTSPGAVGQEEEDTSIGVSAAATGGHTSRDSDDETDPFTDEARSSMLSSAASTSDFSFRSSHSTNIIPIAYIPPHSSSMSISDANRDAFGELHHRQSHYHPPNRRSIPTSLASRDSLALAGAEIIEISPMPPILTPDTPLVPIGASANGAPIRPPRSPGLDLQLPKGKVTSPLSSPDNVINANDARPVSGFPWGPPGSSPANRPNLTSTFSTATSAANSSGRTSSPYLVPPTPNAARNSTDSHLSVVSSTSSSRSHGSAMSYILDPPQIITPINAQGLRRVEVLGRGQAERVRIAGTAAPQSPPLSSTLSSPTTVRSPGSPRSEDPFADTASPRFSVGGVTSTPVTGGGPAGPSHARGDSQSTITSDGFRSNESRWTVSSGNSDPTGGRSDVNSTFYDVPQSARNSAFDTGDRSRVLMAPGMEISSSNEGGDEASLLSSRASFASTGTRGSGASMLDGIPFLSPSSNGEGGTPHSPLFPMPPSRLTGPGDSTSTLPVSDHRVSNFSDADYSDATIESATRFYAGERGSSSASEADLDASGLAGLPESPLPVPFLPFAGQRPTSATPSEGSGIGGDRVQSQAMSIRSGFGSGLSQIPFQLGFPSGLDGSDRGSIMTVGSTTTGGFPGGRDSLAGRDSYMDGPLGGRDDDREGMLSGVEEEDEPPSSRGSVFSARSAPDHGSSDSRSPVSPTSSGTARPTSPDANPFSDAQAQVLGGAGDRASVDTLALSAELSRSLGVDD